MKASFGRHWIACLTVVAPCAGCRSGAGAGSPSGDFPGAPPSPAPSVRAAPARSPSFKNDVLPTLTRHCADAKGCHGAEPTDSVALDLAPGAAYRELVNHPSDVRNGTQRVSPGDPGRSFLLDKLSGRLRQDEGKPMPLDADTGAPVEPSPITSVFVDQVLTPWIRAGARDD